MTKSQRSQKGTETMLEEDAVVKTSIEGAGLAAVIANADQGAGHTVSHGASQLRNPVLACGLEAEAPEKKGKKGEVPKAVSDDHKIAGLRRAGNRHWTSQVTTSQH